MKSLLEFLIDKDTIIEYDPDDLNNSVEVIYDDTDYDENDEDTKNIEWENCKEELNEISNKYEGFISFYPESLTKSKKRYNLDHNFSTYSNDLNDIIDKVITGKDYGYTVRLSHGHLEIDCINSGSRATYYIYALSEDGYNHVDAWYNGENYVKDLNFLFKEGVIVEIKN